MFNQDQLVSVLVVFAFLGSGLVYLGLTDNGRVINGDFTVENNSEDFSRQFRGTWLDGDGRSSVFFLSKSVIYSPLHFLSFLGISLSMSLVYFVYFSIFSTISFVSVFLFISWVSNKEISEMRLNEIIIFAAGSLFYTFSPYVVEQVTHRAIKYGFYLAPAVFYFGFRGFKEGKIGYLAISSVLWSLATSDLHWAIYGALIFSMYFGFYILRSLWKEDYYSVISYIGYSFILPVFYGLQNLYSIIPGLGSGGTSNYGNILTLEGLELTFRNASVLNLFQLQANFNLADRYGETLGIFSVFDGFTGVFIAVLVVMGLSSFILVREKDNLEHIFLGLLFVVAFFLSAGPNLFPSLFNWFIFHAPFNSWYAWAFRTPKFHQFMILAIAPMIAITGMRVYEYLQEFDSDIYRVFPVFFLLLVGSFTLIGNYPLLTGNFNGNLDTVEIPQDYKQAVDYLGDRSNSKIVWGPPYAGLTSSWHDNQFGDLTGAVTPRPTYTEGENYFNPLLWSYRFRRPSLLNQGKINDLGNLLAPLNIGDIAVHDDVPKLSSNINKTISRLDKQKGIKKRERFGFMHIYEVKNTSDQIYVADKEVELFGGLNTLISFSNLNNTEREAIRFGDQQLSDKFSSDVSIFTSSRIPVNYIQKGKILSPFEATNRNSPKETWSKNSITSSQFRNYLNRRNILDRYQYDYGKGLVFTTNSSQNGNKVDLSWNFDLEEPGDFRLFSRYFKNQKGGKIKVSIDGESFIVDTKDQLNKFVWKDLGTFNLSEGEHTITLENVEGFNAVNVFSLMKSEEYREKKRQYLQRIQNKSLVHLFEAEYDMYRENAKVSDKYGMNASNGRVVRISEGGKVYKSFEALKNGSYMVAASGTGDMDLELDDRSFSHESEELGLKYYGPVNLDRGSHNLSVSSNNGESYLDVVWVYSTENNESLEEVFSGEDNANVRNFTRINPTKYRVKVNSSEPYTLSFAEGYDPLWVAEVHTENGTETYESIPLYSVINGFQINETGKHTVIIRYRPQRWFYIGAAISGTTLLFILSWLFWDWRRRKEDEWALRIEEKYLDRREELLDRGKEKLSYVENKV